MLTDHIRIYIFLSWMMENSYSYAVKIFLHVARGSINVNPIPPQVGQVRPKPTMCPEMDSLAFFHLWLELSVDIHYIDVVRCTLGPGCRRRSCPITTFRIPTPSFRYWAYDKMSVVTFPGFAWHKSFPPNCIKHTAGGFWKFKNSALWLWNPSDDECTNVRLCTHQSPLSMVWTEPAWIRGITMITSHTLTFLC